MSAFSQNSCLSGLDFEDSLVKVTNKYGVPEICIFLCVEMFEFHVVGELSCWGLELE